MRCGPAVFEMVTSFGFLRGVMCRIKPFFAVNNFIGF
jgi:hypothetical protein